MRTAEQLVDAAAGIVLVTGGVWFLRLLYRGFRRFVRWLQAWRAWRRERRPTPREGLQPLEGMFSEHDLESLRQLAAIYGATFCDRCRAQAWPQGRCPDCIAKLADTMTLARQVEQRGRS